jgi:hypothetical protein
MEAEALGTEEQLLVDDHLVASSRGVVRTLHPATKVRCQILDAAPMPFSSPYSP